MLTTEQIADLAKTLRGTYVSLYEEAIRTWLTANNEESEIDWSEVPSNIDFIQMRKCYLQSNGSMPKWELISQRERPKTSVAPGQTWKWYNSNDDSTFTIIELGAMRMDHGWVDSVTYRREENGICYTRAKPDFLEHFTCR